MSGAFVTGLVLMADASGDSIQLLKKDLSNSRESRDPKGLHEIFEPDLAWGEPGGSLAFIKPSGPNLSTQNRSAIGRRPGFRLQTTPSGAGRAQGDFGPEISSAAVCAV
jgi:hypothetical protein